jgi:hypothetical protein
MWGPAFSCYTLDELYMSIMHACFLVFLYICVREVCLSPFVLACMFVRVCSHVLAVFLGHLLEVLEFLINVINFTSKIKIKCVSLLLLLALSSAYVQKFLEALSRLSFVATFQGGILSFFCITCPHASELKKQPSQTQGSRGPICACRATAVQSRLLPTSAYPGVAVWLHESQGNAFW